MRSRTTLCLLSLAVALVGGATTPAVAQTATASITGSVVAPDGEPLEGVCVEAFGEGYDDAETATDGSYVLEGLPAGDYQVGFNTCGDGLPGYAPEFYEDARSFEQAQVLTLGAGETREGIRAALELTGSFSGTVLDETTGDPLEGVCVIAFEATSGSFGDVVTAADGTYLVPDLPPGDYTVIFVDCADPLVHVGEFYDDVQVVNGEPETEPVPVVVTSGENAPGIDAALTEGGAIQGTVTGLHTGQEQPLVCVAAYEASAQSDDTPLALALTGLPPSPNGGEVSAGSYTLAGLPAGDYVVAFNPGACEDDGYASSWFDGGATRDEATVLTVAQGEVQTGVDTVVTPLPSISFACPFEVSPEEEPFSDVPDGNVHKRAIECLHLFGIVAGRGDGSYGPAAPVTRAQLASFVARTLEAAGLTLPEDPPNAFDDDNGDIHERAIDQLAALGIVSGKGNRRYAPADSVNRGQMATFLVNAYQQATGVTLRAPQDRFSDDEGNVHETAINKAATAGITAGTGSGYAPFAVVQRDQMASFLARLLDRVQRDQALEFGSGPVVGGEGQMSSSSVRTAPPARQPALTTLQELLQQAARS